MNTVLIKNNTIDYLALLDATDIANNAWLNPWTAYS